MYITALCSGLEKVLEPYRAALLSLEQSLLADPHLTAAHVQTELEEYQLLFPALNSMLETIKTHKGHGCHILEILHRTSASGLPIVKEAVLQLQHLCHGVLYKQLAAWMLHGTLLDRYSEFFVSRRRSSTQDDPGGDVSAGSSSSTQQLQKALNVLKVDESQYGAGNFTLVAEMIPSYLPLRIVEKILFVGESVEMFSTDASNNKRGSILQGKEDYFARCLHDLSRQPEFNLMAFEAVIDEIRSYVAEQLWKLVVEEADLPAQLHIVKDFFLLGRGELYLAFIDQAHSLLKGPPTGTTQHDINMAFQQAARNVLLEDDQMLQKFQFQIDAKKEPHSKKSSTVHELSGWHCLRLSYSVGWPLHILFTPGVFERYNTLLRFLLSVKRVQLELQQCWANQMQQRHSLISGMPSAAWWLRYHMAFLIDNLQYYLQVDVVESQCSVLFDKINSTRDFEAIRLSHDQFLTSLLSQTFLLSKPISHCLTEILSLCHNFCLLLQEDFDEPTDHQRVQFDKISKSFQRQSQLLFQILSSVRSHQASPHLAQLLLRVDFNKYFSTTGGQLGNQHVPSSARRY